MVPVASGQIDSISSLCSLSVNSLVSMEFKLMLSTIELMPVFFLFFFSSNSRYAGLIVLAVDAIMLSGENRRKTLDVAAAPAAIELYFFLQAWFQAAPQAVFQTHLLFRMKSVPRTQQSGTN